MIPVAYFISGHGYGHAVRSGQVISKLKEVCPDLQFHVRTEAPYRLLQDLSFPVSYEKRPVDVGIVQKDSLEMSMEETLHACQDLHERLPVLVEEEIAFIRQERIRLILGDIPPLCFEIASRAAIPSVAIGNFTWNWIYRAYLDEFPSFFPLIREMESFYSKADLALSLPFPCDMEIFSQRRPIPLIARISSLGKIEARKRLDLPAGAVIVLLSFGGFGLNRIAWEGLQGQNDFFFVTTGAAPRREKNLLKEIQQRIDDIKKVKAEQKKLSDIKTQFEAATKEVLYDINGLLKNKYFIDPGNAELKAKLEVVKNALSKYSQELIIDIAAAKKIKTSAELKIKPSSLSEVETICSLKYDQLKSQIKDDKTTDVVVKIELSRSAYMQIEALKKEKRSIEKQKTTFEIVYVNFVKKQKEGLESFINNFSGIINEYYQFMNPDEQIKEIKLKTIENEDELVGLTVCFKYYDCEVSPPHKYFSESHLNCFGLAFFLASVRAFNKENRFILMDDVISSFDANHRKRFADLLIEKFADYQIILLTHEKHWFDYVKSVVQNKNWLINEIKWSEAIGAHLEESTGNLRQKIEYKISNNIDDDLGNNIRVYLEHLLKNSVFNLKVKVEFQFNDKNEDRMCYELLSELKGKAAKSSTDFAAHSSLLDRTLASTFIANKDSHDSSFKPSMGDLKALWKDVQDIENLFYCIACQKYVSFKYYDEGNKKVKCKCGAKEYSWKK